MGVCTVSILGLYIAVAKRHGTLRRPRAFDVAYHSAVFLMSLCGLVITAASVALVVIAYTPDAVYSPPRWTSFIHSHPTFFCALQTRLNCAGYTDPVLVLNPNGGRMSMAPLCIPSALGWIARVEEDTRRFDACPGAFCADFCRVGVKTWGGLGDTDDQEFDNFEEEGDDDDEADSDSRGMNVQPICNACRRSVRRAGDAAIFDRCRGTEVGPPTLKACDGIVELDLRRSFSRIAVANAVVVGAMMALEYVTFYKIFCMPSFQSVQSLYS